MTKNSIKSLTKSALLCALLCVSANVCVPLSLPVTLQTLVLYFSLFFVGARHTLAVVGVYIALGAVGLPVFSGFSGGVSRLFDATGGYIFGMLLAVLLWWLLDACIPDIRCKRAVLSAATLLVIYLTGALWYALAYLGGAEHISESLLVGVLPFILPDALKIYVAHLLEKRMRKFK